MKLKRFLSAALALSLGFVLASCGSENPSQASSSNVPTPSTSTNPSPASSTSVPSSTSTVEKTLKDLSNSEDLPEFGEDQSTKDGYNYAGIGIDDTNAKKIFYVGDEFTTEGLVVKANYRKLEDGDWKRKEKEITNYSVDSSNFNSSFAGTAQIVISYREGDTHSEQRYEVTILPSVFSTLDVGQSYVAGIKTTFKDNNDILKKLYVNDNFEFTNDSLNYTLLTNTVTEDGFTQTERVLNANELKIEQSIDVSKIGTYTVKIQYEGADLVIGGQTYKNVVSSFVLVDVINPVVSFTKASTNDTQFEASATGLDVSGWTFKLTRHVNVGEEILGMDSGLFRVEGLSSFIVSQQVATVTYLGDFEDNAHEEGQKVRPTIKVNVKVVASPKYDIKVYSDLSSYYVGDQKINSKQLEDSTNVDLTKKAGILVGDHLKAASAGKVADNISFTTKITIKAQNTESKLRITVAGPSMIALYVSSTGSGDLVRTFVIVDESGEEIATGATSQYNEPKDRFEFSVSSAGTYTILVPTGGIYLFGVVIATEK